MQQPTETIAVIGLGYVGLPLAHAFGKAFPSVIGFDVDRDRIQELCRGHDRTGELSPEELAETSIRYSADPSDLTEATVFVVTVPTPIDESHNPDLGPILGACDTIGPALRKGASVVFESTFYPGLTESVCVPRLEGRSGLVWKRDFTVAYSPERINPGDREHRVDTIVKVVAADGPETLERITALYERIVPVGVHRAPSIAVAEAAKVIENTQRDVNIALMNELAIIFDRLGLRTADVLAAASTKWNFLRFSPGLVGGHCIGVDPYYLTARAEQAGYQPHVILSGRRVNDGMGGYIADKTIQLVLRACGYGRAPRVGILGVTFKENVPDIRNSRVPDIVDRLRDYGATCLVHDPLADPAETKDEYDIALSDLTALTDLDALVLAVAHNAYLGQDIARFMEMLGPRAVLVDVKSALDPGAMRDGVAYWSL